MGNHELYIYAGRVQVMAPEGMICSHSRLKCLEDLPHLLHHPILERGQEMGNHELYIYVHLPPYNMLN